MHGEIIITNQSSKLTVIDIEGVIGMPEHWQFEEPGQRVATYERFRASLESLSQVKNPEIIVNIRSTGGNVNDALLILDTLQASGATITTRCFGYVASAATVIAQAASAERREISANSLYLIHRAVCSAEGNAEELSRSLDMLSKTDKRIARVYSERSGRTETEFTNLMNENGGNGRWLSPEEVIEYGLADKVTTGKSEHEPLPAGKADFIDSDRINIIKRHTDMNLSKKWNALMRALGFTSETEEISAVAIPAIESSKEVTASTGEEEPGKNTEDLTTPEIASLQAKISALETQNARLAALPTTTKPKEDPSPQEHRRSPNQQAYERDIKNIL